MTDSGRVRKCNVKNPGRAGDVLDLLKAFHRLTQDGELVKLEMSYADGGIVTWFLPDKDSGKGYAVLERMVTGEEVKSCNE